MTGILQTLIEILTQGFNQLNVLISPEALEDLAVTVHKAMTGTSRLYHSLDHALGFWDPDNPIQTIAALYHDIVYYHVDLGFSPEIEQVVSSYLLSTGNQVTLANDPFPDDKIFHLTLAVFGFKPGQVLNPENGLNEFLSALYMNKILQPYVDEKNLFRMTLCIEATIPFRTVDHFYRMEEVIVGINHAYHLDLTSSEIKGSIGMAVNFANIDVKNFAEDDVSILLNDTWKLLPELNVALRHGIYTVREYRLALQKMLLFMCRLNPELIFHQYMDTPEAEVFNQLKERASENLLTAQEYLKIKLLAAAVLEALAEVSGGDAPLSLFVGEDPLYGEGSAKRIEDFLPEPKVTHLIDDRSKLFQLLEEGDVSTTDFDLRNVSLSMFIYRSLDPAIAEEKMSTAQCYFDGAISADEFLIGCKGSAIAAIARAIAAMVPTRRAKLLDYANIL